MSRKTVLSERLNLVQNAINASLANGHVRSYTTEIQGVVYRNLDELRKEEDRILLELSRLNRRSIFGPMGFSRPGCCGGRCK